MNILYVSPFSHGVNIAPVLEIAHLVANEGHNVHFYTVKTSYIEFKGKGTIEMAKIPDNVQMHYIDNRFIINSVAYPFINPIHEYYDLKNIIKENKIDIIHFNFPEHLICLPILKKLSLKKPIVLSINGIPGYDWFYGNKYIDFIGKIYSKLIASKIIKKADVLIPLYSKVNDTLVSSGFADDCNIINVTSYGGSYGVNTDFFKPIKDDEKLNIRNEFNLPTDALILIYAGRFVKVKRLDKIIASFNNLKSKSDNCFLLLVGDGPEKEKLIKLAKENNIKSIKFIDFVDQKTLSKLYAASDIFLLISSGEGNPGSLMEACSCGLPSIVSNIGANSNIIKNSINGFVIEDINEEDLISRILMIAENYQELSKNARDIALKELSWDSIIKNHIKLYSNLIGE